MQIIFNKYHGAGNDFIMVDNRDKMINPGDEELIRYLCNRHMGVGGDGLVLLYDHDLHDFEMKYFNSDGREGTMCGNGGRCAVAFAIRSGFDMGSGSLLASDGSHSFSISGEIISLGLCDTMPPAVIGGNHFFDTGSPHYIINVPDIKKVNVMEKGREIRYSDSFSPGGTNVDFVEHSDEGIFVRTYERGLENETLSCGTGVAAAAISGKWGKGYGKYKVDVKTPGGELSVSFEIAEDIISNIWLSGPAQFVFAGLAEI
ncbi:MAG: diaminopimelate epimerase [Bacteroidales bacterium]|nr:diaminopimelate epimerase [Bacteroidales bacterium]